MALGTLAATVLAAAAAALLAQLLRGIFNCIRIGRGLVAVPVAPDAHWLLGHVPALIQSTPWNQMAAWVADSPPLVRMHIGLRHMVVVGTAEGLKRVLQTGQRNYVKDLDFSFHPFLPILGTGLVTADGPLWQEQRLLIAPALRMDILDDVVGVAMRAAGRLSAKLNAALVGSRGVVVELEEEFRLLTLQVIGEAVLSLPAKECDQVRVLHAAWPRICSSG